MVQTLSYPADSKQAITPSLEVQNCSQGVLVERIDPLLLQWTYLLFPYQFEGLKFLALLCRQATEKQLAMFKEPVAIITFHGIAALCASPDWEWGYHATLRYFILFEALGVLIRLRRNRLTEIHIPLGVRKEPASREQLLQALEDLQQKHRYKDKKVVQLIERTRNRIDLYGIGSSGDSANRQVNPASQKQLLLLQERLISVMHAERIPLAKCLRIAQWMCASQLPHLLQETAFHLQAYPGERFPEQEGDSSTLSPGPLREDQNTPGNSQRRALPSSPDPQRVSQKARGDSQNNAPCLQHSNHQIPVTHHRPKKHQGKAHTERTQGDQCSESPMAPLDTEVRGNMGDSQERLSSKRPIFFQNTLQKETDIEEAQPSQSPRSEETLRAEATWIAVELDGEESLRENRGRGWVGAYKTKLAEHPDLVRASLIDMYLQRSFPDWRGVPRRRGGQWFNKRYKAYVLQEESIQAETESWVRSPYSYEQIKIALKRERHRQEEEISERQRHHFVSSLTPIRPFADCVQTYGLLGDDKPLLSLSQIEQEQARSQGERLDRVVMKRTPAVPEQNRQNDEIEMEDGTLLSAEEYDQLQKRAEKEEYSRVRALLSHAADVTGDIVGAYFEQWARKRLSALPRSLCHDVHQLQAILKPELYTVEVLLSSRRHYAIRVQANDDPTNARFLQGPDQTREFIQWFTEG